MWIVATARRTPGVYLLGMLIPGLAGGLLGPRLLRW
jgi:hypothetical protein